MRTFRRSCNVNVNCPVPASVPRSVRRIAGERQVRAAIVVNIGGGLSTRISGIGVVLQYVRVRVGPTGLLVVSLTSGVTAHDVRGFQSALYANN